MRHGLTWYWHRLRAMPWSEVRQRIAQRSRQREDERKLPEFAAVPVGAPGAWPVLPSRASAPGEVQEALRRDVAEILSGRWRAFGHLLFQVDDPPHWFSDYAARRDVRTNQSAFRLNHRELPRGADIKLIWELSRWHQLVRLAQRGWIENDRAALDKCVAWLEDWLRHNPPYRGWNWTSPLEAGVRLINFAWIDAMLSQAEVPTQVLDALRQRILPAHVWFTWRHRCYGSSANNHLLGELAGLIVALARWPALERWTVPIQELQRRLEAEIVAQFAPDGGNREQALNYQLFSWELCWHARGALMASNHVIGAEAEERLRRAADFFVTTQVTAEPWDYGDSDSATVVPLYADDTRAVQEWYEWFADPASSPALHWWLGAPPPPCQPPACIRPAGDWLVHPDSGQAVCWTGGWQARWDLSPLGYLSMASHGHLDALHLSLWLNNVAIIIDPGTGAYFGDTRLRAWLASWPAHNGPHVPGADSPQRLGPFLWRDHHPVPTWKKVDDSTLAGELKLPQGTLHREVRRLADDQRDGWQVDDVVRNSSTGEFEVRWHFAPGTRLEPHPENPNLFHGERHGQRFTAGFDAAWRRVRFIPETQASVGFPVAGELAGLCSPAFRRIESGPVIVLTARGENPSLYRSTFLLRKD